MKSTGAGARLKSVSQEKLADILKSGPAQFEAAMPFPHIVLDEFLRPEIAEEVLREFRVPAAETIFYHHYNNKTLGFNKVELMGPATRQLFRDLQSQEFVAFLEKLTGLQALRSDPDLDGAGIHDTKRGGWLNMHVDFLAHTLRKNWTRRLNLLIYLNKDWKEEYNGYIEFWDMKLKKRFQKIKPGFNRCVIFRTDRNSFHGYPDKLECPTEQSRKSIAFYYYREEDHDCSLKPTYYQYLPNDPLWKKGLIVADRFALRVYSFLKRNSLISDSLISKLTKHYK